MGRFFLSKQKAHAIGETRADGFLVFAGSTAMKEGSPDVKRDRPTQAQLIRDGVLVAHRDPDLLRFTQDHLFSSVSAAGGVIKDGNSSGTNDWRDVATGKKMSELP